MREGFWRNHIGMEKVNRYDIVSSLPWPVPAAFGVWPPDIKVEFLQKLLGLEVTLLDDPQYYVVYRGYSGCRVCGVRNGSREFCHKNWQWPEGYRHYVEMHDIMPSLAFQEMILGREIE